MAKGQGKKVGPDLYGVVGRAVASEAGFNYSAALKAKGGTWTFDALDPWLANPREDVPGTLMTFGGVPSQNQRADVIAYLNSNSESRCRCRRPRRPSPLPAHRRVRRPPKSRRRLLPARRQPHLHRPPLHPPRRRNNPRAKRLTISTVEPPLHAVVKRISSREPPGMLAPQSKTT